MRFILKCAFWLGLVAFLLPFGTGRETNEVQISWLGAVAGVQEAVQDLSGFCERAPQACEAGREAALFAGERIGEGLAIAYDVIDARRAAPARDVAGELAAPAAIELAAGAETSTDPVTTGTLPLGILEPGLPLPRAYVAPRRSAPIDAEAPSRTAPVIPTPAPRV